VILHLASYSLPGVVHGLGMSLQVLGDLGLASALDPQLKHLGLKVGEG